ERGDLGSAHTNPPRGVGACLRRSGQRRGEKERCLPWYGSARDRFNAWAWSSRTRVGLLFAALVASLGEPFNLDHEAVLDVQGERAEPQGPQVLLDLAQRPSQVRLLAWRGRGVSR